MHPYRLSGGRLTRSKQAADTSRSTANALTGYAGDTLASALLANGRVLRRTLVQIPPPARHRCARLGGAERARHAARRRRAHRSEHARHHGASCCEGLDRQVAESLALARIRRRRGGRCCSRRSSPPASTTRRSCGRLRSGRSSTSRRSAPRRVWDAHRNCRIPTATSTAMRIAMCSSRAAGARVGGCARWLSTAGKRVILADENPMGSRSLPRMYATFFFNCNSAHRRRAPGVRHLRPQPRRHAAARRHPGRDLPRQRLWQVRAREIVVRGRRARASAGFRGQRPAGHHARGKRAQLRAALRRRAGPSAWSSPPAAMHAYAAARDCCRRREGAHAHRPSARPARRVGSRRCSALGMEVLTGHTITRHRRPTQAYRPARARLSTRKTIARIACDALAMHGGWTPAVHLYSQARGKLRFDGIDRCLRARGDPAGVPQHGRGARRAPAAFAPGMRATSGRSGIRRLPERRDGEGHCLALREGFESIEHVKRYTTTGMATDQGKTSNMSALGWSPTR